MINYISKLKFNRQLVIIFIDAFLISTAWVTAYALRFNLVSIPDAFLKSMWFTLPLVLIGQMVINYSIGVHRGSWRFCSIKDLWQIIKAAMIGLAFTLCLLFVVRQFMLAPRSIPFIYSFLLILFLGAPRFFYRQWRESSHATGHLQRVLIIGAGSAGESLARDLLRNKTSGYVAAAFMDDHPSKIGRDIHGLKVHGDISTLPERVKQLHISLVIIAMPTASSQQIQRVVSFCEQTQVPFRIVPSVADLTSGRVTLDSLRNVSLEDLLGRDQVQLDWEKIAACVRDNVILVSGGAGSIGSELCRQIARFAPKKLIIVDNNEFNLYSIDMELKQHPEIAFVPILQDVCDKDGINAIMQHYKPDIVFHAAAYKHVPLLEEQIRVALQNNVVGTQVLAEAAAAAHVAKFIMISTDKAVRPTNIMGASKRIAEIFCQNLNRFSQTQFITVRFGNVLGSAGSVIPLFKKQLKSGGPITVTHPEITRYFMTIKEATQLILQATTLGKGGEIFVLDMGEPIKIQYLAEQIIQLAGFKVDEDIEIKYTGLRPGEKLHEELFHEREVLVKTQHKKIFLAQAREIDWAVLQEQMQALANACARVDAEALFALMQSLVPEYHQV